MNPTNPFITAGYYSSATFCHRQEEVRKLIHHSENGINTILLGVKRIGKTALIHHLFSKLQDHTNKKCIYVDINSTVSLEAFIISIYDAVMQVFPDIKHGNFNYTAEKKTAHSLLVLFELLDKQNTKILIAIDEFQQIAEYPEKNTLSILQNALQKLKNLNFIFCCSNEYALNDLAGDNKQAFFANSDLIQLYSIKENVYSDFITHLFQKHKRNISTEAAEFILAWTRCHTFYTQTLCRRVFFEGMDDIEIENVHEECGKILAENESSYFIYRNLLSPVQWLLLKAISKDEKVYHPTAKLFLQQHHIGTPANVQRALEALLKKEMVFASRDEKGRFYQVYDCFLSRWLENLD